MHPYLPVIPVKGYLSSVIAVICKSFLKTFIHADLGYASFYAKSSEGTVA